jgi:polyhydroxybutyrate depolymerase
MLPLLNRGQTLGTTLYGSADLGSLGPEAMMHLADAVEQGLSGFTLYVDWAEFEVAPGAIELAPLIAVLDQLNALDLAVYLNITVGDIGQYNLPSDLSDGNGGLAAGRRLDEPEVIARFAALLDELVPAARQRGVFLLGVGNEIDDRLDRPGSDELASYTAFAAAAREHVKTLAPELDVAVTLTATALLNASPTFEAMREAVDHVAFNYGPIAEDWFVREIDAIADDFRRVLDAHGPGPIVIQELTCPDVPSMGATPDWQARCFGTLLDVVADNPSIRFVSIFSLQDFEAATCEAVQAAFPFAEDDDALPPGFRQRFLDYLCGLGILAPDGTAKPAWTTVLDRLSSLRSPSQRLRATERRAARDGRRARSASGLSGLTRLTLPLTSVAGGPRRYLLYVPDEPSPIGGWPLVLHFHGGGGQAESARVSTAWDELADRERFAVAFGEGTRADPLAPSAFGDNPQTWNDGTGRQAIGAIARGEDDLGYVAAVLDDIAARLSLARGRIYATGFSNGAGMALSAARHFPERLAAVAAVAGKDAETAVPPTESPLSLLYMTGTDDPLNPLAGGEVFLFGQFLGQAPPIEALFGRWLVGLACPGDGYPITTPAPDAAAIRFFPCIGNATAELWLLEGHGHHWPGGSSLLLPSIWTGPDTSELDATAAIWAFFESIDRSQQRW